MKRNLHLLIIDPQNDFCDLPKEYLPSSAGAGATVEPDRAGTRCDVQPLNVW